MKMMLIRGGEGGKEKSRKNKQKEQKHTLQQLEHS